MLSVIDHTRGVPQRGEILECDQLLTTSGFPRRGEVLECAQLLTTRTQTESAFHEKASCLNAISWLRERSTKRRDAWLRSAVDQYRLSKRWDAWMPSYVNRDCLVFCEFIRYCKHTCSLQLISEHLARPTWTIYFKIYYQSIFSYQPFQAILPLWKPVRALHMLLLWFLTNN